MPSAALPTLFFAHANGFSPGAYTQMLRPLAADFEVRAPELKPLRTGIAPSGDWREIAADLGTLLDASPAPMWGVGHSLGAVSLLMLATQRPERFKGLVLIEPPTLPAWGAWLLHHGPRALGRHGPMARWASRRVDRWNTRDEAWAHERAMRWLARVPDDVLDDVLRHGLHERDGLWRLRFQTAWESTLYEKPPSVWALLRKALPPIGVLRGALSPVFSAAAFKRWQHMRPRDRTVEVPEAGHLLPLEKPARTAALIGEAIGAASRR